MESQRDLFSRRKPRVILDKRFPFTSLMNVGDKGQLKAQLIVDAERLKFEEDGNERKFVSLMILEAEPLNNKEARLT